MICLGCPSPEPAAMPILCKAHRVTVLSANEDDSKALACLDCFERVANYLRWHGISVETRYVGPGGRSVLDAVLQSAGEAGADLLVMGGYGHTRLGEWIFG